MRTFLLLLIALAGCLLIAAMPSQPTGEAARSERFTPSPVPEELAALDRVAPESRARRAVVPTEAPPVIVPQPVSTVAPPPEACPATYFCYPRLGIAGAIVPYSDSTGASDVGLGIRQLTYIQGGIWLAGHAYTQFGWITGFRAGDVVVVRGQRFEISGSSVQRSCEPTTQAVAPLSLQTSLESSRCGRVLVVQGRAAP